MRRGAESAPAGRAKINCDGCIIAFVLPNERESIIMSLLLQSRKKEKRNNEMKMWKKALGLVLALVCLTILSGGVWQNLSRMTV